MKKMNVFVFVLAMVGCAAALGNSKFSESKIAVLKNGNVFKVIYQGPMESTVKVTIVSPDDQEIFTEKIISDGAFIRPYNFSKLPEGDYKICIDDQNGRQEKTLCHTESSEPEHNHGSTVADQELISHVVKIRNAKNKYLVSVLHRNEDAVKIQIYDQHQQLIHSEMQKLNNDFAKVYVLQNLEGATIGISKPSGKEKLFPID
jgi:hypothetical protein